MKHIKKYENFFDKVSENIKIWKIRNNIKRLEQKLSEILSSIEYYTEEWTTNKLHGDHTKRPVISDILTNLKHQERKTLKKLQDEKEKLKKLVPETDDITLD